VQDLIPTLPDTNHIWLTAPVIVLISTKSLPGVYY